MFISGLKTPPPGSPGERTEPKKPISPRVAAALKDLEKKHNIDAESLRGIAGTIYELMMKDRWVLLQTDSLIYFCPQQCMTAYTSYLDSGSLQVSVEIVYEDF